MLFTSPVFLLFLLLVLMVARSPLPWRWRKVFLLFASYYFYASWNPPFVLLLLVSTVIDFVLALGMARVSYKPARTALLVLSLVVNLGLLSFFKYANFFADSFVWAAAQAGWQVPVPAWSILLPVGISFYTFQTLSYTIDVYRGKLQPTRSFTDFALFVSFFPQLVAGPIVRASEFLPQLAEPKRADSRMLTWGVLLFIVGLFKKAYLADAIFAPVVVQAYGQQGALLAWEAWTGTYAFAGQIFCDFSGYSDMAIASALMLGFRLPENFRAPYGALGFSDFWRRWHISLSSWLRDYLYVPLGGNRKGLTRTQVNLAITMLLGGLWHGAAWTFVFWGGLHGAYLAIERVLRRVFTGWTPGRVTRALIALATFHCVCIGWVFFRAESFEHAARLLAAMTGLADAGGRTLGYYTSALALAAIASLVAIHGLWGRRSLEDLARQAGWAVSAIVAAGMLFLVLTKGSHGWDFIYFQF